MRTSMLRTKQLSSGRLLGHVPPPQSLTRQPPKTLRPGRKPCCCSSSSSSNSSSNGSNGSSNDLPSELQGLSINDQGMLVDDKTGEVINEYGATRFDVAVRAIRGEFDPAPGIENTDQQHGLLMESLVQFPCKYDFQVVAKGVEDKEEFVGQVVGTVARVCQTQLNTDECCKVKERMGGKYLSIKVEATVRAPELITAVFEELGRDERIMMKF